MCWNPQKVPFRNLELQKASCCKKTFEGQKVKSFLKKGEQTEKKMEKKKLFFFGEI